MRTHTVTGRGALASIYFVATIGALTCAAALAAPSVILTNAVVALEHQNDRVVAVPLEKGAVHPGGHLRYTITAKNTGNRPALHLVPVGHISRVEAFLTSSLPSSAEYSVDGGKTWSKEPTIEVKAANGTSTRRKAERSEYTAVRWIDQPPLAPNGSTTFSYEVVLR